MNELPRLSVVEPVHDEEDNLELLHREICEALKAQSDEFELVLVDDGSRDRSLERMRALAARDPRVRLVALEGNHGQAAALDAGFRAARGEITATLDADLQNDPHDLPKLLSCLDRADVVNGVRVDRHDSLVRKISWSKAEGIIPSVFCFTQTGACPKQKCPSRIVAQSFSVPRVASGPLWRDNSYRWAVGLPSQPEIRPGSTPFQANCMPKPVRLRRRTPMRWTVVLPRPARGMGVWTAWSTA